MITYIILLWILIKLSAPAWPYILLGVAAALSIFKWGIELGKK